VVKALKEESIYRFLTPVVIGSKDAICQALEICGLDSRINVVDETLSKVVSDSSTINLVDTGNIGVAGIKMDRSRHNVEKRLSIISSEP